MKFEDLFANYKASAPCKIRYYIKLLTRKGKKNNARPRVAAKGRSHGKGACMPNVIIIFRFDILRGFTAWRNQNAILIDALEIRCSRGNPCGFCH